MTRHKILAALAAIAGALAIPASPVRAQDPVTTAAATAVAVPIVEKAISTVSAKPNPKGDWLKAEVLHADSHSIVVCEEANERMIHTFTYAPEIQDSIQRLMDRGGYQYGDKVKIRYDQTKTVALKIRGKPSKPL
jgi:hypothetical protein